MTWKPASIRRSRQRTRLGDRAGHAYACRDLGWARFHLGAFTDALACFRQALEMRIKQMEIELEGIESQRNRLMTGLPNVPHASVPVGKSDADNPVVRTWGEKPTFDFEPKAHWDIGPQLGILDFERAAEDRRRALHGAAAAPARGSSARSSTSCSTCTRASTATPRCCRRSWSTRATLAAPASSRSSSEDLFKTRRRPTDLRLYLIPTAEVPVTNLHARRDPRRRRAADRATRAYTPCFRSEAGSLRQGHARPHPPAPVRQGRARAVRRRPRRRYDELEALTQRRRGGAEARSSCTTASCELCTGDLGFAAAKTYDLEVWLPGQDAYREISLVLELRGLPGAAREDPLPAAAAAASRARRTR